MKRSITTISIFFISFLSTFAQNKDTTLISITNFRLDPGTFNWRGTDTFHDMTAWDSSPYTEGHLKEKSGSNWLFRMNYRLLFPVEYDASFDPGYPIIVMLHGAGERGNCWDAECYCDGCNANDTPDPAADPQYLNNDHVLLHGGAPHLKAVNLAGSKKPGDPTLDPRAFPGFVLFPQNENFWGSHVAGNSGVSYAIRIIRLLVKEHNIDPDRIYIHGLSFGGQAVYKAINMADWLFAAAATMSAISFNTSFEFDSAVHIPLWAFQGGKDEGPYPAQTEAFIKRFREAGGTARYTVYPELGHGTWNKAYSEPDFFSWFLSRSKSDIQVYYNNTAICASNSEGVKLSVAQGFRAYQWELDGAIIPGATSHVYNATSPGIYRARFSRVSATPAAVDWNEWSAPVTVTAQSSQQPIITQVGTTYLKDLNEGQDALLKGPEGLEHYYWYKDDVLTNLPDTSIIKLTPGNCGTPCANAGKYTLVTAGFENCPSAPSAAKYVFFEDQAPTDDSMRPSEFSYQLSAASSVFLTWNDNSDKEVGYEIWRKNTSLQDTLWEMATLTNADVTQFHDTVLTASSTYFYKIRAISPTARSSYFPGDSKTAAEENLVITTTEGIPPTAPQNLTATLTGINEITLSWQPGTDEVGVKEYAIHYAGKTIGTGSNATTYTIKDLSPNTLYTFTVKTIDVSSVVSVPSNQVSTSTFTKGLFYKHTTGNWSDLNAPSMINSWTSPDFKGHVENFTLEPRTQDDYFNFEFEGYIYISKPGNYTFYLNSNDGSRLYLNGVQEIDFDGVHNLCTGNSASTTCPNGWGRPSKVIALTAGAHLIKVQMFEFTGEQNIQVRYNGPDTNNATVLIPAASLNSGTYNPPPAPAVPTNLAASAKGLTTIELTWQSTTPNAEFEIYKSLSAKDDFIIIDRVATLSYTDSTLKSGTTYYYKLRAVTEASASKFTAVVNATTDVDDEAPTQPTELKVSMINPAKASVTWAASQDNVGVTGYEIWVNGSLLSTTTLPGYEANELHPDSVYNFSIIAFDAAGNKSTPSDTVPNKVITALDPTHDKSFQVSIYPNPSSAENIHVKVNTSYQGSIDVALINMLGKTLYVKSHDTDTIQKGITISTRVTSGLYYVVIRQNKNIVKRKIVIQ